jgi:pimeloyl-ACP methyl ester carboxylesterase
MGSFLFGGSVLRDSSGDTYHGDHGYAQFFVPEPARNLPLILWHGLEQSGKTWESTPDGRDGFWQIFTRRGWPLYIIDQPRRGRAGRVIAEYAEADTPLSPTRERESADWTRFRLGIWHPPSESSFFDGVQFPQDPRSIAQFFAQQTPNTGPEPFPNARHREFLAGSVGELIRQVGPCALVTHSHSGQYGWTTAIKEPDRVRAVIALEPGEFAFPDDDVPDDVATNSAVLRSYMAPQVVAADEFAKLASIPVLVMMGDNIATDPHDGYDIELWRIVRERAKQFTRALNARGGQATYLELPALGIRGNTHFPMTDLNNVEIAGVIEDFLARHGLDASDRPHQGPRDA